MAVSESTRVDRIKLTPNQVVGDPMRLSYVRGRDHQKSVLSMVTTYYCPEYADDFDSSDYHSKD